MKNKHCTICNNEFIPKSNRQKYCGEECYKIAKYQNNKKWNERNREYNIQRLKEYREKQKTIKEERRKEHRKNIKRIIEQQTGGKFKDE